MNYPLEILLSSVTPFTFLILPGILIFRSWSRVILLSVSINILATLLFTFLHIPISFYLPILLLISSAFHFVSKTPNSRRLFKRLPLDSIARGAGLINFSTASSLFFRTGWGRANNAYQKAGKWQALKQSIPITVFLLLYIIFSVSFIFRQNALPTGDSQKTIFWANRIIENNSLPDYQSSITVLNRDPVDFYTPGLHTLFAATVAISPDYLASAGFFAIALAISTALIAVAISREIWPRMNTYLLSFLVLLLSLAHLRFLRYLVQPGYHLQNILGELLLFGLLLLITRLWKKWNTADAVLSVLLIISLFFSHQFSAFIAAFILLPIILIATYRVRSNLTLSKKRIYILITTAIFLTLTGFSLGLQEKIPHIFTLNPHLLLQTPQLSDYPRLLGSIWIALVAGGLLFGLIKFAKNKKITHPAIPIFSATIVILILSQAPRIFIDIPPVRALLYLVIPGSIIASGNILSILKERYPRRPLRIIAFFTFTILLINGASWLSQAFSSPSDIRTNSTYTSAQTRLTSYLRENNASVLYDDYNQRSLSWLLLSGQPTYARLASEGAVQMQEASQSRLRYQLYLNQLDFEKIFALGSFPEITNLLSKHNIEYIASHPGSSSSTFSNNPALELKDEDTSFSLYSYSADGSETSNLSDSNIRWLLNPSTLANDIGDKEDTYKHLPASLSTARLSDPILKNNSTYRFTTAPIIPLRFNVDDYVRVLWDQESNGFADRTLTAFLLYSSVAQELKLQTPTGYTVPLSNNQQIRLESSTVPLSDDGFITLYILNPTQQPVFLDLISLGLANVP